MNWGNEVICTESFDERVAAEEGTGEWKHVMVEHYEEYCTFKKAPCKSPKRELHYGKYSSISGLEQHETRGTLPSAFPSPGHAHTETCHPNQLQAAGRVTFSRNFLSCLLNEVFPLLLMPCIFISLSECAATVEDEEGLFGNQSGAKVNTMPSEAWQISTPLFQGKKFWGFKSL